MAQAADNNFRYENEFKKKKIVHLGFRFRINEKYKRNWLIPMIGYEWMIDNTSFYMLKRIEKYSIKFIEKLIFKKIEFKNSSIIHNFLKTRNFHSIIHSYPRIIQFHS